ATVLPLRFLHDPATTGRYTLSLHDALPISRENGNGVARGQYGAADERPELRGRLDGNDAGPSGCGDSHGPVEGFVHDRGRSAERSEEHTSELQSRFDLVCRLLLEKKK